MSLRPLRIGTRGSRLALIQTEMVRDAIAGAYPDVAAAVEMVVFETKGDLKRDVSIEQIGGRGVFTDELDQALLDGAIDLAVHSVKDLPVPLDRRLTISATPEREDPREAFVSPRHATLASVPSGAVFGSASLRRESLVKALRPDVNFVLLRGNVEQRVAALEARGLDGTILAVAGLKRLGLQNHIRETLEPETLMPDPGQGAIGIVCRVNDARARFISAAINHAATWQAVAAERAFLTAAGSHAICGALAIVDGGTLVLSATLATEADSNTKRGSDRGPTTEAEQIGRRLAQRLLAERASRAARQGGSA